MERREREGENECGVWAMPSGVWVRVTKTGYVYGAGMFLFDPQMHRKRLA